MVITLHNFIQLNLNSDLRRFKSCSRCVGDSRWWRSRTMVLAGNKSKRFCLVNYTTKTIHHHFQPWHGFSVKWNIARKWMKTKKQFFNVSSPKSLSPFLNVMRYLQLKYALKCWSIYNYNQIIHNEAQLAWIYDTDCICMEHLNISFIYVSQVTSGFCFQNSCAGNDCRYSSFSEFDLENDRILFS